LRYWQNHGWLDLIAPVLVKNIEPTVDLAVFHIGKATLRQTYPAELGQGELTCGQPVFFLGFPYGDHGKTVSFDDPNWGFPFVKWAYVYLLEFSDADGRVALDGYNNPGFLW
jgi:hypothetical protein